MRSLLSLTVLSLAATLTMAALAPAAHAQLLDDFSQGTFNSGNVFVSNPSDPTQTTFQNTASITSGFSNGAGGFRTVARAFTFTVTNPKVNDNYSLLVSSTQQALNISTGPATAGVSQVLYTDVGGSNLGLNLSSSPVFRVAFLASDLTLNTEVRLFTSSGELAVNRSVTPTTFSSTPVNYDYDFSSFAGTGALNTVNRIQFTYTGPQGADYVVDGFSLVAPTGSATAPEPGSIALLLTAGVPLVSIVRRRAKNRA